MALSKDFILESVSSYEILDFYLKPHHKYGQLKQGQNINNPLLNQKQDTPSFNIYCKLPGHEWTYNDFATNDKGSCFDLVMKLHNLTFSESLERIANDFNLTNNNPIKPRPSKNGFSFTQSNNKTSYSFIEKPFSQIELAFWAKFNIDNKTLSNYNVISLAEYTGISKSNKEYKVKSSSDNFIFGYKNESWIKIYLSLGTWEQKSRILFLG